MNDMGHVIRVCSKGQISIVADNDLKYIDMREPHQTQILSRVLDHIGDLNQNKDGDNGLPLMAVSTLP